MTMIKLFLLLWSTTASAERATRRIRTILEIPDDVSELKKSHDWNTADKELEEFFARALHNDWSLSYPPLHDHGHHHGHSHSHNHNHHHQGPGSSYYDDDYSSDFSPFEDEDDELVVPNEEGSGGRTDDATTDDASFVTDDVNAVTDDATATTDDATSTTDDAVAATDDATTTTDDASTGDDDSIAATDDANSGTDDATTNDDLNFGGGDNIVTPTAPSPAPAGRPTPPPVLVVPLETELPTLDLVVPNEVEEEPTDPPSTDSRACSSHPACSAEAGLCCPDFNNVFKACCFGLTFPPLDDPTDGPLPSPTEFPSASIPSDLPSDTPSSAPFSSSGSEPPAEFVTDMIRSAAIESKCAMTEAERSELLIASLAPETNSPAFEAYQWLDFFDDQILCPQHPTLKQRSALATIYYSLNGPNWTTCSAVNGACENSDRWLSRANECDWFGVACNSSDEVTVLTLKENGLSGDLPDVLFTLTTLTGLSLDHNKDITGSIPPAIGELTVLEYIELDDNRMGGEIPEELYSMTTLKAIDLNGNSFSGSIPDQISNLSNLMVLQLEDNTFDGPLPWFGLAMLKDLLVMYLHGNNFNDGSLEPVCNLMESRRNTYAGYLQFMAADCDSISCSCCSQCF